MWMFSPSWYIFRAPHRSRKAKLTKKGTDKKGILELNVIHDPNSLSETFVLCNKRAKKGLENEMHHLNYKLKSGKNFGRWNINVIVIKKLSPGAGGVYGHMAENDKQK